jgi:hypothetical protein
MSGKQARMQWSLATICECLYAWARWIDVSSDSVSDSVNLVPLATRVFSGQRAYVTIISTLLAAVCRIGGRMRLEPSRPFG